MRQLGLHGVHRGKVKRTTIAEPAATRPRDLGARGFGPLASKLLWPTSPTCRRGRAGRMSRYHRCLRADGPGLAYRHLDE